MRVIGVGVRNAAQGVVRSAALTAADIEVIQEVRVEEVNHRLLKHPRILLFEPQPRKRKTIDRFTLSQLTAESAFSSKQGRDLGREVK